MDNNDWRQRLYVMVFQADTPAGRRFDTALLLIILCSLVVVVLDSINSIHRDYAKLLAYIEWGFTFVFAVEYGLRLYCSPKPLRYAFSFYGLVDLLAVGVFMDPMLGTRCSFMIFWISGFTSRKNFRCSSTAACPKALT